MADFFRTPSSQVGVDEFSVDQMLEAGLQEVGAAILIVEVVGMLPNIDHQNRFVLLDQRRLGVDALDDGQFSSLEDQPGPTAAELGGSGILEIGGEFFVAAQVRVDFGGDFAARFATTAWLQAFPEEAVVPDLSGVVVGIDSFQGPVPGLWRIKLRRQLPCATRSASLP